MPSRLSAVSYDAADPVRLAEFWGALLDRSVVEEADGALVNGDETQVALRFVAEPDGRPSDRLLHLHLTSATPEHQQLTVERVLDLGGRHLDVGQEPDSTFVVMGDPAGNAFCVIEAGNGYLAGTGYLGEVSCDGSREVGLFWRDVLGWPLVWDENEETVVQSPAGGTKVAWGGPPITPKHGRNPQHFDLVTDDLQAEVDRLVGLGAARAGDREDGVQLTDPDGNEFMLSAVVDFS